MECQYGRSYLSSVSLDPDCISRLRLVAQEAALGLESTRTLTPRDHRLLLPWKHLLLLEIHRAWLPGLTAYPLCGSVLCLFCSICLLYRLPGSAPRSLLTASPELFPYCFLSILLHVCVPPYIRSWLLFNFCLYPSSVSFQFPSYSDSSIFSPLHFFPLSPLMHIQCFSEKSLQLLYMWKA